MLTKFKDKVILAILVLVVIGSIIIKVVGSINEEIKCDLEHRYYSQNNAFLIDCKYNESMQYQSSDKSDLPRLAVHVYVYNNIQDDYKVTVDEVLNYLSEEYDSSGKPYIYSCPDNINAYIECYPEVNKIAFDFGIRFMDYMTKNNKADYWEMEYKDVERALEEYKNDPDYVAPGLKNDEAKEDQSFNWDYYKSQLTKEDSEDFSEYISVLNDESKFYCFDWCNEELTFSSYLESIMAGDDPEIAGIALIDIDGKNGKELIIHLYEGGGNYLILTRDGGKFYGTNLGERLFEELQNDGKYLSSGGAGDLYLHTMSIDGNGVKTNQFGELHGKEDKDGNIVDHLVVDGKEIEKAKEWLDENYSDPIKWIE